MAPPPSQTNVSDHTLPEGKLQSPVRVFAPPGLLRCLILSWSEDRAQRLKKVAKKEAWEVAACSSARTFLQYIFHQKVPLTLVDLPRAELESYAELRGATDKVREMGDSLLIICGAKENKQEETWARQLGVWAYVSEAEQPAELGWVFVEARKALAKIVSARVDSPAIQVTTEAHLRLDEKT